MRYLGIDYGLRYVGLAFGDDETRIASPYTTIDQTEANLFDILKTVIDQEDIEAVVVGMPERKQAELTQNFINTLAKRIGVPIFWQAEHFTSQEAQQHIKAGSTADEHSIAAMLILQGYLDDSSSSL